MNNCVAQEGDKILYTNSGSAISTGDVVRVGNRYGIAEVDIAATTGTGIVAMKGVYEVAKTSGTAYTAGDELYWDVDPGATTKTPGTDNFMGICWEDAASVATTVKVMIHPAMQMGRAANVAFTAGTNLTGVDGSGSNAAPLAGTETRLDALDTFAAAIKAALINAGIMAPDA